MAWLPHSSSVDFCEQDYRFTDYVAEYHNTWSSLCMSIPPLIGIAYSNPTKEWRFHVMYLILAFIGLGSASLHATLNSIPQSLDEVPMLWMNYVFIFALFESDSPKGKPKYKQLPIVIMGLILVQTIVYYMFQRLYFVFIVSYISLVTVVIFWTGYRAFQKETRPISRNLWISAIFSYLIIGSPLWIFEMSYCDFLKPYYDKFFGLTFHILWHLGAGFGTYLAILNLVSLRVDACGGLSEIKWIFCRCFPVISDSCSDWKSEK